MIYETHPEACIVSCFFNPQKSVVRRVVFQQFHKSIKHLNHRIVECAIGDDNWQLPESEFTQRVRTKDLLWHKEGLLNQAIRGLPRELRYIFWVDADVLFTNPRWLSDSVGILQSKTIVQPFEYCVHLERGESQPGFDLESAKPLHGGRSTLHHRVWRSFGAAHAMGLSGHSAYNIHGHVGFAWGARREVLAATGLYDKALACGADHIMAHAAVGQIIHPCIQRAFGNSLGEIAEWSNNFHRATKGKLGYAPGDLYHLWHGDVDKRAYHQVIPDFDSRTDIILSQDESGLYASPQGNQYLREYFGRREVLGD